MAADKIVPTVNYCYICGQLVRQENGGGVHSAFPDGHEAEPVEHHARTCGRCDGTHRCRECRGQGSVGTVMCVYCDGEGRCQCVQPQDRGSW